MKIPKPKQLTTKQKIFAFIVSITLIVFLYLLPDMWFEVPLTRVLVNQQIMHNGKVYISVKGLFLISYWKHGHQYMYVITVHPNYQINPDLCEASSYQFDTLFPGNLLNDRPWSDMDCEEMPGLEELVNPHFTVHSNHVHFITSEHDNVDVTL